MYQQQLNRDIWRTLTSRQRKKGQFLYFLFSFPRATVRMASSQLFTQGAWRQRDCGDKKAPGATAQMIRLGREPAKFPPAAATSRAPHHLHGLLHPLCDLLRRHRAPAAGSWRGRLLRLHTALGRQRAQRRKPGRRGSPRPELGAHRLPFPAEFDRRGTRERFLGGPGWPGPIRGGGGAAAAAESAAERLCPRPRPARVTVRGKARLRSPESAQRGRGVPAGSAARGSDGEAASWCTRTPPPRQPAPPGPEDAEIYVEFSQTSQKEMYLPGHGPRRWVTAFLERGVGRRGGREVAAF